MENKDFDLRLWAYVRQTSIEIAQAIYDLANGDYETMQRIYDAPTDQERDQVLKQAWGNSDASLNTLFWGWPQPFNRPTDGAK